MTKTLLLVRHAQAEESSQMLRDFDRELTGRGIMDAARLGHHLRTSGVKIECIKTSASARTYQTVKVLAEQLKFDVDAIESNEKIYGGGPQAYLAALNATPDSVDTLLLCGHNPDISYFAEYLTRAPVDTMTKCTLLAFTFGELAWEEVSGKTGTLTTRLTPESLKENNR